MFALMGGQLYRGPEDEMLTFMDSNVTTSTIVHCQSRNAMTTTLNILQSPLGDSDFEKSNLSIGINLNEAYKWQTNRKLANAIIDPK